MQVEVRWSAKCVDKPPNAKCAKLSPKRFSTPQSDKEMTEIYKGKQSANTQKSTAWEVKPFRGWISKRNSEDQVSENFLDQNFAVEYDGRSKTKRWKLSASYTCNIGISLNMLLEIVLPGWYLYHPDHLLGDIDIIQKVVIYTGFNVQ